MNLKKGLKLNQACGQYFVVPMGESNVDFSKIIALNESSLLLWRKMEEGDFTEQSLVETLLEEYEVDEATATNDVKMLLEQFDKENLINK